MMHMLGQHGTDLKKPFFRESMEKSYQLTSFETMQIDKVCNDLVGSLEEFEKIFKTNAGVNVCFWMPTFLTS